MSDFGLTVAGFVPKTQSDVYTSIVGKLRGLLGASLDVSDQSLWGQVIGVFSGELAECWEAEEESQSSLDPDASVGVSLIAISGLTGTLPEDAIASSANETFGGTSGTIIPTGTVVSVLGRSDTRFLTQAPITILAVSAWATAHHYVVGDRVTNGSPAKVYQCIQEGTSAGSGGPTTTALSIADNTVVWQYLGAGTGAVDAVVLSEKLDAITAPATTLTRIDTPVVGLSFAYNFEDANVGRAEEVDLELRARREIELRTAGKGNTAAIRAAVSQVDGVKSVVVFENTTYATNVDGMPPKSIEAVVQLDAGPPLDVEDSIREAIFSSRTGGIEAYGQVVGDVVDNTGGTQEIGFSYLEEVDIYVALELDVTSDFPIDGEAQVKAQTILYEAARIVAGYDAVAFQVAAWAQENVPGIFDVTDMKVGTTDPPLATRVTITSRQLAAFDTSRITVTTNLVTP